MQVLRKGIFFQVFVNKFFNLFFQYYNAMTRDQEEKAEIINKVSKHQSMYHPYKRAKTPDWFWEVDMPSTQEWINRGKCF